ncbi:G-type lectin S-receptor-like serine/threonine-protein kinase At4g27290 [Arachis hypogaea]|uniref:G-type lectin S-receptor-like serine/threonine-protein kinase At4g27290 n=1 Tax=Arachis hypogaea TaxID=3818 RepID=UPI000DECCD7F|nr:G-type lectin S-receptor-like serine/threonine-protein kinase At4g27290 [Arachis hypogaea]
MEGFTIMILFFLMNYMVVASTARDTIDSLQSISDGEIIVSSDEIFALGFFSPGTSKNRYVGIWFNKDPSKTVVWVANREKPLTDSSGILKLNNTGTLVLLDRNNSVIWSSNATRSVMNPIGKLLNSGNLVVQERSNNGASKEDFVWQSFDYPSDTLLPGQKLGTNLKTGQNWYLTSWNSSDDPFPGRYTLEFDINGYPQLVLKDGGSKRWRAGSWNGVQFSGTPQVKENSGFRYKYVSNEEEIYFMYELINNSNPHKVVLTPEGINQRSQWNPDTSSWTDLARLPADDCDYYETCGAYSSCNVNNYPMCSCLDGFVQDNNKKEQGLSDGCVRRTSLDCYGDGFLKYSGLKLPDTERSWYSRNISIEYCKMMCLKNCSCVAYAALDISEGASGCLMWFGNLNDIKALTPYSLEDIYIRMAATELEAMQENESHKSNIRKKKTIIIVCALSFSVLIICLAFIVFRWKIRRKGVMNDYEEDLQLSLFDMSTISSATNNFSADNILGKGGFGSVYKGVLKDGKEIAVKRLLQNSSQGIQEFKNEVMHIAKLQHRNLVKLLGCCIYAEERLLVYEFMPNKSLDYFIFDEKKSMLLDWTRRFDIINGIARGLLYLHQDSRHRIVHRDLKAANVLLDGEMNPKISDFGLARSFGGNETKANTRHVVGTYGYLSPEYIIDGVYSIKSDVFSFGVLVLEIVSGSRNRGFIHQDHHFNLLGHAWKLFMEDKGYEIIYAPIRDASNLSSMLRSIHVGLLCVQKSPDERPNMSYVVQMLSSESTLPPPKMPGFFTEREMADEGSSPSNNRTYSINDVTDSILEAR